MEQKEYITFSDFVCKSTGLTNYPLAYIALDSIGDVNVKSIMTDIIKYITAIENTPVYDDRKQGQKIEDVRNFQIPYAIYEYYYLLKDDYVKDTIRKFCNPLKAFQKVFAQYQTDVMDGHCYVSISEFCNLISSIKFEYSRQFLTSIQPN